MKTYEAYKDKIFVMVKQIENITAKKQTFDRRRSHCTSKSKCWILTRNLKDKLLCKRIAPYHSATKLYRLLSITLKLLTLHCLVYIVSITCLLLCYNFDHAIIYFSLLWIYLVKLIYKWPASYDIFAKVAYKSKGVGPRYS